MSEEDRRHHKEAEYQLKRIADSLEQIAKAYAPFFVHNIPSPSVTPPATTPSPYIQPGYQCPTCGGYFRSAHVCGNIRRSGDDLGKGTVQS